MLCGIPLLEDILRHMEDPHLHVVRPRPSRLHFVVVLRLRLRLFVGHQGCQGPCPRRVAIERPVHACRCGAGLPHPVHTFKRWRDYVGGRQTFHLLYVVEFHIPLRFVYVTFPKSGDLIQTPNGRAPTMGHPQEGPCTTRASIARLRALTGPAIAEM